MKKILLLCLVVALTGCTYGLQDYLDDPRTMLKDPHYESYLKRVNDVERSYLNKEITYAEYVEKKQRLDDNYTRDVQDRNRMLRSQ